MKNSFKKLLLPTLLILHGIIAAALEKAPVFVKMTANQFAAQFQNEHALILAAKNGNTQSLLELLAQKVNPDFKNDQSESALLIAANKGYAPIIESLLEAHADIEIENEYGATPLHIATQIGRIDAVKTLLDYGASTQKKDLYGSRPIDCAKQYDRLEIIKILNMETPNVDQHDLQLSRTALIDAWHKNYSNDEEALIPDKSNTVAFNESKNTVKNFNCPHNGLLRAAKENKINAVRSFLTKGADPNFSSFTHGITPIIYAVSHGNTSMIFELLEHGSNPKIKDKHGKSAIDYAQEQGIDHVLLPFILYKEIIPS